MFNWSNIDKFPQLCIKAGFAHSIGPSIPKKCKGEHYGVDTTTTTLTI